MIISAGYFDAVDEKFLIAWWYDWRKHYNKFSVIRSLLADNRMNTRICFSGSMICFVSPGFIEFYVCAVKVGIVPVDYEPETAVRIIPGFQKWFFCDSVRACYFLNNIINLVQCLAVDGYFLQTLCIRVLFMSRDDTRTIESNTILRFIKLPPNIISSVTYFSDIYRSFRPPE